MATFDEVLNNFISGRQTAYAIFGQESAFGRNARTSPNGAVGPMQIMPATFKRYAAPGESITDPQHNLNVGMRMIDQYAQRHGGDPGRIATAYFSGEGNVAPAGSPYPFRRNPRDAGGKSTLGYVGDILTRLNPVGQAQAAEPQMLGSFDDALNAAFPPQAAAPTASPLGGPGVPTFDDALNLAFPPEAVPEAAAPPTATTDVEATTPDRIQQPGPWGGTAASMFMTDLAASGQGVNPNIRERPSLGQVGVDDGGKTIIDMGSRGWMPFDPKKHVVLTDPATGLPAAWARTDDMEEGLLSRLGRFLRSGIVFGERFPLGSPAARPPASSPAEPLKHWSNYQPRDALGRFSKGE